MKISRLAIIGFGNVGQGMAQILHEQADFLAERFGIRFKVVAVNDMKLGSLYHPDGLPLESLLQAAVSGNLNTVPASVYGWSVESMIDQAEADTLVEVSYTDLKTGEPALGYIRKALQKGWHVVTTNKGPIALCFPELRALARKRNVRIGFEGTVMSGTPALALGWNLLAAAGIQRVQGIFNGTTNFILTRMEAGASYDQALTEAQSLGYAEADPTGDVEGYDAAGKVVILGNLVMDSRLSMANVEREGITKLTPEDIRRAQADGKRWKLIGRLEVEDGQLRASVRPTLLPIEHPLASVSGATNAVTYTTALLGDVTLIGPGAGRLETGYALINDLLAVHGHAN